MNTYQYVMTRYTNDCENITKCNEPRLLLDSLQAIVATGDKVDVIDGYTGEVLCALNCPDPYIQEAFGLMMKGRMFEKVFD